MKNAIAILMLSVFLAAPVLAAAPKEGEPAPDFNLVTTSGQPVSLKQHRGKVVLIGMFHICVPCMNQALEFNKIRKAISEDKLVILGINTSGDSKNAVKDYLGKFPEEVNFPYLLDPKQTVHESYIQRDMPTVLIIDKNGNLKARSPGVGADQLIPYLKKLV